MTKEDIRCWDDTVEVVEVRGPVHVAKFPESDKPSSLLHCNFCGSTFFQKYEDGLVCVCTKKGDGPLMVLNA